jgi:RNA polymerase sigma factor (sigma-70 family)
MPDESQLLTTFARERDEDAFTALVRLHLNLVFATALRQLGNHSLAEEVTQTVFLALAQKAPSLRANTTLAGWLYQTTVNQSRQRLRTELRRQRREETAAALTAHSHEGDSIWSAAVPLLDEALLNLPEPDRLAVLLHYMEERPFREVGQKLGIGEDAARKRVDRILEDLTEFFRRHGFALPSATLAIGLSQQAAQAAPAHLKGIIVAQALSTKFTPTIAAIVMATSKTSLVLTAIAVILTLSVATSLFFAFSGTPAHPGPTAAENLITTSPRTIPPTLVAVNQPPTQPPPQPPTTPEKNFFERINDGDESLAMLSHEIADAFIARNRTNAQSLLTAYRVTHDMAYLKRAAADFPNDPAVAFRVLAHDAFPEQRRAWLDQFKKADPENSLPAFLSARDFLEKKDYPAAYAELLDATKKPAFRDYITDHIISLEEIYLNAGYTPAQAKTLGMSAVEMPHIAQLVSMSRQVNDLVRNYQQSGDNTSAEALIQSGLAIADRLKSVQDGGNLLGEMVGLVVEKNFLQQLDPQKTYPFLNTPITPRLQNFPQREAEIRADSQLFSKWIAHAPENEILIYFDRLKLFGETAALQWLKSRSP